MPTAIPVSPDISLSIDQGEVGVESAVSKLCLKCLTYEKISKHRALSVHWVDPLWTVEGAQTSK